jgi:RNA polymerase sigma-70 factor (ECF subfamily)
MSKDTDKPTSDLPLEFAEIYQAHRDFVWRVCRRMGVPDADLPDACQEIFFIVHRKLHELRQRASLRAWIVGISTRVAAAHRRRASSVREIPVEKVPDVVTSEPATAQIERSEARALLDAILEELDDNKRAVFVLYELEQVPMAEIAESLGCPLQTAYSRLHSARRQVEEEIARRAMGRAAP